MNADSDGNDLNKTACDVVRELVTTVLTLSTALTAAAIAFGRFIGVDEFPMTPFTVCLVFLAGSILFGLLTLMAIVSTLANGSFDSARNIWVSTMAIIHLGSFFCGVLSMIWIALEVVK
jgi:hypothetical protein